ncbi:MAG TPA: CHAD domain-containing protein [Methylomirabilota bacterium]|nr:CHAD domain-containing protein [Methylomirabilota bacterium]
MSESPATPRPVEIELKYRLREEAAGDRYLLADELAGFVPITPVRSTQLEDRYLDTADGAMARAGFACRLRQTAKGTTVSVKSTARRPDGSGFHRREELEGPADRTAGPRDWPPSDARSLILEQCGDAPLVELVTIRQLRRKRHLQAGETVVELSLDEVDAVARSRVVERFVELEVELVQGDESQLAGMDALLADDPALAASTGSKLESALAAVRATSGRRGRKPTIPLPDIEPGARPNGQRTVADVDADAGIEERIPGGPATTDAAEAATTDAADATEAGPPASARDDEPASESAKPERDVEPVAPAAPALGSTGAAATHEATGAADAAEVAAVSLPGPEAPRLVVGKTPGVLPDDHVAEAGRKVFRFHFARMLAREAGTRDGKDPEDLHSMRVATRRQRAAWRVFGAAFRPSRTKTYRGHLRDVASRLGAVRDLDVLLEAADAYRADLPTAEQRALEPLLSGWRTHRDDARKLLIRELDSDGYRRWLEDYGEFVRHEGLAVVPVAPTQPHRVRDTAASQILTAYEGVRAYEPVLRWADVETLHELRIAGKWLRYTLEFVREALAPEAANLIARVTAMQDHLGELNDADVTSHMVRSFLVENAGGLSTIESGAIARYLVVREKDRARLRRTVGAPWRGVAGMTFRRSLGRTIASL